jgi:hypothetical protein
MTAQSDLHGENKVFIKPKGRVLGVILLVAAAVCVVGAIGASESLAGGSNYTPAQWDSALGAVIHADNSQSVKLPSGKTLWVFGDTIQVNGRSTVTSHGYPHDAFVTQDADSLQFTPVKGQYGYGWQQVPNWPDGSYFWMSTPMVQGNNLYILGSRVKGVNPYQVIGQYVARFNVHTLALMTLTPVPDGGNSLTVWGGAVDTSDGWWISGTQPVACRYSTDCRSGDLAWVPHGDLATPSDWQVHTDVIPSSDNLGTALALYKTSGDWFIYTKTGDSYGGTTIERLSASSPTGTWQINGSWAAPGPSGTYTYAVSVHPEQRAPHGQVLVSYNVQGVAADDHPLFVYLPR